MRSQLSLKVGISGVRGVVGESLTPQLVASFATAFGTYCGAGPVLVGTDSRPSREMVKHAVMAGLLGVGCRPIDVGIVPVPSLQLHTREMHAFGAICITASHNPIQWNALKFFGPDGMLLRPNQAAEVTDLYHQGVYPRVSWDEVAHVQMDGSTLRRHREAVLAAVNVDLIRSRRFRVAVDCCNGAASVAAPEFLTALGCDVMPLYTDPNEPFPRNPEPVPENLGELSMRVKQDRVDVGFAVDADADRLAIVNEAGEPIGEDCTLAIVVRHVLARKPGLVVANVSTSMMLDAAAHEFDCEVIRTRVGEINVLERMIETGASIGGEGNGGVIMPGVNACRDSFVGMALVLEAMATSGETISQLRAHLPSMVMVKDKLPCAARGIAPALRRLRREVTGNSLDLTDGVKVLWPDRWLQARGSNTEPIIRVIAEAPTAKEAQELVDRTRAGLGLG